MPYDTLASSQTVEKTAAALKENGFKEVFVVTDRQAALAKIKELIPAGASVMNGASETLEEIGYTDYLKSGEHQWRDLHAEVGAENDKAKRDELRKQAVLSDYYLGSVHALVEDGQFVIASQTGSQLPHLVYTSPNLILVVGTQKIVKDLPAAMERLEKYVVPLEEKNMQKRYGGHTSISKLLIFKKEPGFSARQLKMILVQEKLGF